MSVLIIAYRYIYLRFSDSVVGGCLERRRAERWQLIAEHFGKVGSLRNKIYKISARRARNFFFLRVGAKLFFISVVVVDTDETPAECQHLAKGDEHAVVYLAQWRAEEPTCKQYAAKPAQTDC